MPDLFDAIEFAARAHHGQYRKSSPIPYILHPLGVARLLIECGASPDVVIAAVLHDVVEDTSVTLDEVRAAFGDEVARLVQGMSEPDRKDTWENRKRDMLATLETAPEDLLLIELADKLDNIRAIHRDMLDHGDAVWKRFSRGRAQQQRLYEQFLTLFQRRIYSDCGIKLVTELEQGIRSVFPPSS